MLATVTNPLFQIIINRRYEDMTADDIIRQLMSLACQGGVKVWIGTLDEGPKIDRVTFNCVTIGDAINRVIELAGYKVTETLSYQAGRADATLEMHLSFTVQP